MFRRIVNVVEYVALAGAAVAVALLLFYKPAGPGTYNPAASASASAAAPNGATIFVAHCAGCHGSTGEGGIGPKLGGGAVVKKYANEADEVAVVRSGRGGMPAWQGTLSPAEIAAVVTYTRTGLG